MEAIDFRNFTAFGGDNLMQPDWAIPDEGVYSCHDGIRFVGRPSHHPGSIDMVQLSDGAYLFASDFAGQERDSHCQSIVDSDWLHVQFWLEGSAREQLLDRTASLARSCVITRYPQNSIVHRTIDESDKRKVVCLLMSPKGLQGLLETSDRALSEDLRWLAVDGQLQHQSNALPLRPAMVLAINDIVGCMMRGAARRAFMRAKALELIAVILSSLQNFVDSDEQRIRLTESDRRNIENAKEIMLGNIDTTMTLSELSGNARHAVENLIQTRGSGLIEVRSAEHRD